MKKSEPNISWTPRTDSYERSAAALSASYMSDTKWLKVFGAIADSGLHLEGATWKFIDSERLHVWGVPCRSDLLADRLTDGRFQLVEYKWIEWIRFPPSWHPVAGIGDSVPQDIETLGRVLESAGRFHYVVGEEGLTLFGYRR